MNARFLTRADNKKTGEKAKYAKSDEEFKKNDPVF